MSTLLTASLVASLVGALALAAFGLRRWRRHGFRFSLRTSLVALTLASLMLAAFMQWAVPWFHHWHALHRIRQVGGEIAFDADATADDGQTLPDDDLVAVAWNDVSTIDFRDDAEFAAAAPFLSELLTLEGLSFSRRLTDASLRSLAAVEPPLRVASLQLMCCQITDLAPLTRVGALDDLFINSASLTDEGLQALPRIPGLKKLFIVEEKPYGNAARFDVAGYRAVGQMKELEILWLARVAISSESAAELHHLTNLRELLLARCLIDNADVAALREALPNCKITFKERTTP
jgi:hypothetical protein